MFLDLNRLLDLLELSFKKGVGGSFSGWSSVELKQEDFGPRFDLKTECLDNPSI